MLGLLLNRSSPIMYDEEAQSPFFNYIDRSGVAHQVWYDSPTSLRLRYTLARQAGLRGVGSWRSDMVDYGCAVAAGCTRALWSAMTGDAPPLGSPACPLDAGHSVGSAPSAPLRVEYQTTVFSRDWAAAAPAGDVGSGEGGSPWCDAGCVPNDTMSPAARGSKAPSFRAPSLVQLADGTILAISDERNVSRSTLTPDPFRSAATMLTT